MLGLAYFILNKEDTVQSVFEIRVDEVQQQVSLQMLKWDSNDIESGSIQPPYLFQAHSFYVWKPVRSLQ